MMALNTPKLILPGIVSFLAIEAEKRGLSIRPIDEAQTIISEVMSFDKPEPENPVKACLDAARTLLDKMEARNG